MKLKPGEKIKKYKENYEIDQTQLGVPPWVNKEFLALRDAWYDVLYEEGFHDIEHWEPGVWYREGFLRKAPLTVQQMRKRAQKVAYFERCREYLYDGMFKDDTEKMVWQEHAEGRTQYDIIRKRKEMGLAPMTRDQVNKMIIRIRARMLTNKPVIQDAHLDYDIPHELARKLEVVGEFGEAQQKTWVKTIQETSNDNDEE